MRRTQAILVILSLLAVPLALMACVDSCTQVACPCCADMGHGKSMNCQGMTGKCAMGGRGEAQQLPVLLYQAHQDQTAAIPFAAMAAPVSNRTSLANFVPRLSVGFHVIPLQPPRA